MTIPEEQKLNTKILASIFDNTSATYKYYWFVAILDLVVKEHKKEITFWEIIAGMVAEAWYPIHYFRLSFGKSDSFYNQIIEIQHILDIPVNSKKPDIKISILNNLNTPRIKRILTVFKLNVPYRFLSPWIKFTSDTQVILQSQSFINNCLYAINGESIEINSEWEKFLNDNYIVLRDFAFWNLSDFIQKRNPNVPDIPSKLVKPITRESLSKQRSFWNTYIDLKGSIKCIYTGKELFKKEYDLDHFIPWSYFTNDSIWNIIPAEHIANIQKNDNLPLLEMYLKPFAKTQQEALKCIYAKSPNNKLLEDYLTIHDSLSELIRLSENDFLNIFQKTFSPMVLIAENMGFKYWQNTFEI